MKFSFAAFFINVVLVNGAYFLTNYLKRGTFVLEPHFYIKLLLLFNGIWLMTSLITRKFNYLSYSSFRSSLTLIARNNLIILYLLAVTVVLMGLTAFSRLQLFGTCLMLFILELGAYTPFYFLHARKSARLKHFHQERNLDLRKVSIPLMIYDFLIITASFYALQYFKRGTLILKPDYETALLGVLGLWLVVSLLTRKFERHHYKNFYYAVAPYVKSFFIMFASMAVIVFALRLFFYSRLQIFGTFMIAFLAEVVFVFLTYKTISGSSEEHDVETTDEVKAILKEEELPFELEKINEAKKRPVIPTRHKLQSVYLKNEKPLLEFLDRTISLDDLDESDTCVAHTRTRYNIETIDDHSKSLIINLHRLNDFRWLNRYFLTVHRKIYNGGYFVGKAHTIATHKKWFYKKLPKFLADVLYPFDFVFHRVLPKLPGIQKAYFLLTGGRNRVLSKAEILGRLYFCGFKVLAVREIQDDMYYIAQRVRMPSLDENPSYGPTIKLKRIGLDGKIIYTRKMRTMHPYSEYLQEYIYDNNQLQDNGKFRDDFRITEWGNLFRKMWIDELPQLINFLQGEMAFVGVRALSPQYFKLYPQDLQDLRIRFKPGLVPPYYADMPKSFDEIVESERRYLLRKKEKPLSTDVIYFFKAMYNIFVKNARSR